MAEFHFFVMIPVLGFGPISPMYLSNSQANNGRKKDRSEDMSDNSMCLMSVCSDAILGLRELFTQHPKELSRHLSSVFEALMPRVADGDRPTREALKLLLRHCLLTGLPQV